MTYNEFINSIIMERGQWSEKVRLNKERGCERHHILPNCMGGEGDYIDEDGNTHFIYNSQHKNCIYLYPSEHFIAHKLLAEENSDHIGLVSAWFHMCNKNTNSPEKYIFTPEEYEEAKLMAIDAISKSAKDRWNNYSEEKYNEICNNMSKAWKNFTDEDISKRVAKRKETIASWAEDKKLQVHNNRSNSHKGQAVNDETRKKHSEDASNSRWFNNGIKESFCKERPEGWVDGRLPQSEKSKKKVSERVKGNKWYNNGVKSVFCKECPDGYKSGRILNENQGKPQKCYIYDCNKSFIESLNTIKETKEKYGITKSKFGWDKGPYKGFYYILESDIA